MAVRTKLNTGETNGLDDVDDLDAVYVNNLKKTELNEDLLAQFLDISKELEQGKKEKE
ncbi:MAG: hypothetical protein RSC10_07420 [Longicatena sp.]